MLNDQEKIRSQFPFLKEFTYIDAAHYTPYPLFVADKLAEFIKRFTTTYHNLSFFHLELGKELRGLAAKLINAKEEDIAITTNTTHGINIFANGIRLSPDDNNVAFIDSEFPAVVYPWLNQEKLGMVNCYKIPSVLGYVNEVILKKTLLENNIRVFNISHVQFLGYKYNIKSISEFCRKHGIYLLVDAIQSTGVNPIDVNELGIDCLCTGNQKWFMSPAGVGFMYISKTYKEFIDPTYISTINVQFNYENFLDYKLNFREDCAVYENSTPNTLGMIGFAEVIKYFQELGVENIYNHIIGLQDILINEIDREKFRIESDLNEEHRSNILLLSHIDRQKNSEINKYLEQNKMYIALREGYLRVSPHIYNNEDDMKKLANLLNTF